MDFIDDSESSYAGTPWPCAAGLLAGTLALMTRWADPQPAARAEAPPLRPLMARKIASNLYFLREHPDVPVGLRLVSAKLHAAWSEIASGEGAPQQTTAPQRAAAAH